MVSIKVDNKIWQEVLSVIGFPNYVFIKRFQVNPEIQIRSQSVSSSMAIQYIQKRYQMNPELPFHLYPIFHDQCPFCYEFDIRIVSKEGSNVCTKCGYIVSYNNTDCSYYDDPSFEWLHRQARLGKIRRAFESDHKKRRNHFRFWLQRIQGKERHRIPLEDLQDMQTKIELVPPKHQWDYLSMKRFLKRFGYQKYYHHVYYLLNVLCNMPLVQFTSYHEEQLMDLFQTIQQPFRAHRGNRVNMLGYTYLLIKFIEILGWEGLHETIPRLNCHRKIFEQDKVWKLICSDLGFPFIRTTS